VNTAGKTTIGLLVVLACIAFYVLCGFYSVPPIGAAPKGRTAVVWRSNGESFFDSPDALCLRRTGEVSPLCRGLAIGQAPLDRIVLRLPYMSWAYRASLPAEYK
jgi:hypothetical protein